MVEGFALVTAVDDGLEAVGVLSPGGQARYRDDPAVGGGGSGCRTGLARQSRAGRQLRRENRTVMGWFINARLEIGSSQQNVQDSKRTIKW